MLGAGRNDGGLGRLFSECDVSVDQAAYDTEKQEKSILIFPFQLFIAKNYAQRCECNVRVTYMYM